MGHEFCGTVTEPGEGVEGLAVGERVAIEPIFACGACAACGEGKYNLCDKLGFVGLSGGHGSFSAYSVVPARMVHKMPEGLSLEQGALVEPSAVALHAVRLSSIRAGDSAAVFGAGPIGLLVVEALRPAGREGRPDRAAQDACDEAPFRCSRQGAAPRPQPTGRLGAAG